MFVRNSDADNRPLSQTALLARIADPSLTRSFTALNSQATHLTAETHHQQTQAREAIANIRAATQQLREVNLTRLVEGAKALAAALEAA
jgi:hypothetical protein